MLSAVHRELLTVVSAFDGRFCEQAVENYESGTIDRRESPEMSNLQGKSGGEGMAPPRYQVVNIRHAALR